MTRQPRDQTVKAKPRRKTTPGPGQQIGLNHRQWRVLSAQSRARQAKDVAPQREWVTPAW